MLGIIWLFMTGVFLMTLGCAYHTPKATDAWVAVILWGLSALIVAVIQCILESD